MKKKWYYLLLFFFLVLRSPTALLAEARTSDWVRDARLIDSRGEEVRTVQQWEKLKLQVDYRFDEKLLSSEEVLTVQLPEELRLLPMKEIELLTETGETFANVSFQYSEKQIEIRLLPAAKNQINQSGSFTVFVRMDHHSIETESYLALFLKVEEQPILAGRLRYQEEGKVETRLTKSAWQQEGSALLAEHAIALNRSGESLQDLRLVEVEEDGRYTYQPDSLRVFIGDWEFKKGEWVLENSVDITDSALLEVSESGYVISFDQLEKTKGVEVRYQTELKTSVSNGERIANTVTLYEGDKVLDQVQGGYTYVEPTATAWSSHFKIEARVHSGDDGFVEGAIFELIQQHTGKIIATATSQADGFLFFDGIRKDDYLIRQTYVPEGREREFDYLIQAEQFDDSDPVYRVDFSNPPASGVTRSLDVVVEWDDQDNKAGHRPTVLPVNLVANGVERDQSLLISAETNWQGRFERLSTYEYGEFAYFSAIVGTLPSGYHVKYELRDTGVVIQLSYKG